MSRRNGDSFIAGANNASILLGRDRLGGVESGYGSVDSPGQGRGAGAVHIITGRVGQDPSIQNDSASVYMSAKTDPDAAAGSESIGTSRKALSGIVARADCIRISSRTDFKLSVGKAYLTIDSSGGVVIEGDISLGQGAAERLIRGDSFSKFWNTVVVPTPMGPSGPPPPIPDNIFSPRSRVA